MIITQHVFVQMDFILIKYKNNVIYAQQKQQVVQNVHKMVNKVYSAT